MINPLPTERAALIKKAIAEWHRWGATDPLGDLRTSDAVVRSLELELQTGVPHCPCHLKPTTLKP